MPVVFLDSAFTVHLTNRKKRGNKKPGNAGPVFFVDSMMPTVLWGCIWCGKLYAKAIT